MVQAARSGVQNIAEGSQASGTSKKTELKLTNVARASLEELRLDYEDFLRQRKLSIWELSDPRRQELIEQRFTTADQFAKWTIQLHKQQRGDLTEIAANGLLALLSVTCKLLDRQLAAQADAFQREGGFTERLYRTDQLPASNPNPTVHSSPPMSTSVHNFAPIKKAGKKSRP